MERSNDMEARRSFSGAASPLQEGKHNKACSVNSKKIHSCQCRVVRINYTHAKVYSIFTCMVCSLHPVSSPEQLKVAGQEH